MDRLSLRAVVVGWVVASLAVASGTTEAASGDADGIYTVTVTKVELSKDSGATFTTVFEGSQSINIASATAGAVAAGLVSGTALDAGTYTHVRVTIGSTLQFKGYVNNGATTLYTDGGTDTDAFSTNIAAASTPGGDYAVATFSIPSANRTDTTTGLSIQVLPGQARTVRIVFDTSSVLTQSGGIPSLSPPDVQISAS